MQIGDEYDSYVLKYNEDAIGFLSLLKRIDVLSDFSWGTFAMMIKIKAAKNE